MDIRSHLEKEIEQLRKKDNKYKVPTDKLLLMAANNQPKLVNEIRYNHYEEFKSEVYRLVEMKILLPIGKYREEVLTYTDFWILPKGKEEYDVELFNHVLNQYQKFDMSYYRLKYNEFKEDKAYIDILHNYFIRSKKERYTVKELGFRLFQDEKAFDIDEEADSKKYVGRAAAIVNKLSLTVEDFNAYYTLEPLFIHMNKSFFKNKVRKILVIEERDTFYTMAFHKKLWTDYDMFILGNGEKILKSFRLASEYDIQKTDEIYYFGSIELKSFHHFAMFIQQFDDYNMRAYEEGYKALIQIGNSMDLKCSKSNSQNLKIELISDEIKKQFPKELSEQIMDILLNKRYIPQEAIRFSYTEG